MAIGGSAELQELVDAPNERLDAEYKSWLDLVGSNEARADLARHIAALANHGGGCVVFGFNDEMQFAGENPFKTTTLDRDLVASIVKRYLDPSFQCDVIFVRAASGHEHPVIAVPPHSAYPICAKADGPQVSGKPQGIRIGTYYTRKVGPESAPIITPAEWAPIIRRCALHERSVILGAINATLHGVERLSDPTPDDLLIWHGAAHSAFLAKVEKYKDVQIAEVQNLRNGHFQFSYAFAPIDDTEISQPSLLKALREVNYEIRDLSAGSWLLYPYTRPDIAPKSVTDVDAGLGDDDFLQCDALQVAGTFWRASSGGRITIIRQYFEDNWEKAGRVPPGAVLSPNVQVQCLAEFIRHARGMAERFERANTVSFRCEWNGISGRRIDDLRAHWFREDCASDDRRVSYGTWPISALASDWPAIASKLVRPLLRAFMLDDVVSPEWINNQASGWR
jgi:hypothetical protein